MNMGNPKRSSQFLCIRCMKINQLGSGIQRKGNQRKKKHIKDLTCFNEGCNGAITKNVEIRWCDDYLETFDYAQRIRSQYYTDRVENNNSRK